MEMKKLFFRNDPQTAAGISAPRAETPGTVTRTCRYCGKTFTLPENVQHWPDACQECRAKLRPERTDHQDLPALREELHVSVVRRALAENLR